MINKVLFDGSATQGTPKAPIHGGGEYAKFILKEAIKKGYSFDIIFNNNMISDTNIMQLVQNYFPCNIFFVSSKQDIYKLINDKGYTVFYSALPYDYSDFSCPNTKFIQVIHGLRGLELPWDKYKYKYFQEIHKRFVGKIISKSLFIQDILKDRNKKNLIKLLSIPNSIFFTVSEHSKYSLLNFFPFLNPQDIKVFYSPFKISTSKKKTTPEKQYYLMVNGNRFEKNIYRAILAFDKLISENRIIDKEIIITGCDNDFLVRNTRNPQYFKLLPYVSEDKINDLYKNAFAFIYPSLSEGFGYPPLLAMGYGVPVIASACSSISEVCDCGAIFFNPLSIDELSNRILQIEYNNQLRENLIFRGSKHVESLLDRQKIEIEIMLRFIFNDEMV